MESPTQPPASGSRQTRASKAFLFGAIYTVIIAFTLVILAEAAVRLLSRCVDSYRSAPFRRYDPELGVSLIPSRRVAHHRSCFRGDVAVNRWGMRDRERELDRAAGTLRIALLGDSIVEGAHVSPGEVMNIRMEELLHRMGFDGAEVLNFGIAGIGTTQQLLIYERTVRHFRPDVVVLIFSDNDVMNNSSSLQKKAYGIHEFYAPYYDLDTDGSLAFRPVKTRKLNGARSFLERNSLLTYYVERTLSRVTLAEDWKGVPIHWGVYGDPPDQEWASAWLVTERVLNRLRDAVSEDGARFLVLSWPNFSEIDPDWNRHLSDELGRIPKELRPDSLVSRLSGIAMRNGITFDLIGPYMQRYRDAHGVQWPYFSLQCDPHPSALGHEIGAESIVDRLNAHAVLAGPRAAG